MPRQNFWISPFVVLPNWLDLAHDLSATAEPFQSSFMKIALFGLTGIKTGKHNLKDPRLDETHRLIEADKQTHAQVDVVGEDQLLDADAILVSVEGRADMI